MDRRLVVGGWNQDAAAGVDTEPQHCRRIAIRDEEDSFVLLVMAPKVVDEGGTPRSLPLQPFHLVRDLVRRHGGWRRLRFGYYSFAGGSERETGFFVPHWAICCCPVTSRMSGVTISIISVMSSTSTSTICGTKWIAVWSHD